MLQSFTFLKAAFLLVFIGFIASSCSSESTVYHWAARPDTGPNQFIIDHNYCIRDADPWPLDVSVYDTLDFISPGPHDPRHRLDAGDERTWASFIPYQGAQVIYVNDTNSSAFIASDDYASCMESRGYEQRYDPEVRENLILDRRAGYRGDYEYY